ncbi:Enoyl-[acyl-carrier-protein] reductase [NADH], chloroplastic [Capsicum annuum]|uniref:Enoyl-[acyl-carrier-protein] reductase [NADH], chloroplastic n=1 Tax=Capsicum annuum TaxID=4072 RepID=A0A2G3AHN4_CAPAN|nr:Enoyl-[acyl-carrier-protein] reductase [NADH], chloroplastic [Capsicum annuum]
MEITKVYPLDAVFDSLEDVPEDIKTNKCYAGSSKWTVSEVAESVKEDFGSIDILVHSLANGPEVLAFEAGRKQKVRVNTIAADEVGNTAAFLASPLASAITGAVIYVDNCLNAMGVGVDSPIFKDLNIPKNTE